MRKLDKWRLWLALGLLSIRFMDLGRATFINDEPDFQLILSRLMDGGEFPTHGLAGSRGYAYGPAPFWIYWITRSFTDDPQWIIATQGLFVSTAIILLVFSFAFLFQWTIASWLALLLASSPYLFFYSRNAWDNTFNIFFTALAVFSTICLFKEDLARARPLRTFLHGLLGFAVAMAINTHLMCAPFVGTIGFIYGFLVLKSRDKREKFFGPLVLISIALLTLAPYLHFLSLNPPSPVLANDSSLSLSERVQSFFVHLWQFFLTFSQWRMRYFLDATLADLSAAVPEFIVTLARIEPWAWALKALAAYAGIRALRGPLQIAWIFPLGWLTQVLFIQWAKLGSPPPHYYAQPHYFNAMVWAAFGLLALGLSFVKTERFRKLFAAVLALTILGNCLFVAVFYTFVRKFEGTRGVHYNMTVVEMQRSVERVCQESRSLKARHINIDLGQTVIFPKAIVYLAKINPACRGMELSFLPHDYLTKTSEIVLFRWTYPKTNSFDTRLVMERWP